MSLIGIDTPGSEDNAKVHRDARRTGREAETIIKMGKEAAEFTRRLVSADKIGTASSAVDTKRPSSIPVVSGEAYNPALLTALPGSPMVSRGNRGTPPSIEGKRIRLEFDVQKTDEYGRTLAYVYLGDGTFVNAEIIKAGYAKVMTVSPNMKYQELFVKAEKEAREHRRGLWA